ncbi:DUF1127 domain-containing protein [Granulosicoccus antarcticus]|uniref:YjiS-like domain-containing protein n=1 Tax=Granulosicoccus antarcticus IMCC3135 TaxID=1192854 RepID=A0A2Z2NQB0_9GAMM|nr:DUF1127 domain-containing protein [Granulosicoccus antarcticus]ASJ70990.1 hypothetical protein IMCC3135_04385 [Granulosicoccus antarcticus IMCC3135]
MATICTEQNRSAISVQSNGEKPFQPSRMSLLPQLATLRSAFRQWLELRREQRDSRDAFAHLLKLDDALLQDIGVTRAEVQRAAKLPLAEDAAQALYEATGRSRNRRV